MTSHWLLILAIGCGSSPPPHEGHTHHGPVGHRFEHADDWARVFDDPARDAWQKPDVVVSAMRLAPGMTAADIGAGTGYFEARLAAAVGATGVVLAVDIEPDMVRYLGERAAREKTPQVHAQLATADDPTLGATTVDRILVVDTWHHLPARGDYAKKLAAALKPGGFVLVVDFTLETDKGPPKAHRLAPDVVRGELEDAGLRASVIATGLPDQYVIKGERAAN